MKPYTLHHGDCLAVLRTLPDASVDAIVTDPPYGLSFMGKRWDYDVPSTEVWAECLRVLKPGGHLLAFAGTRTQHRMACRIEDAGFDIRDLIAWVYSQGFPKSHNLDGAWQGWGTALKPALEPITVARKPLDGTVAENVLAHGTGALNVDGCRVPTDEKWEEKEMSCNVEDKFWKGKKPRLCGSHESGRWPANLIHDGSEEVVGLFPETESGKPMNRMHTDPGRNVASGASEGGEYYHTGFGDSGSAARFFYCAKAAKADRDAGCEGLEAKQGCADYRPNDDGTHGLQSRLHGASTKGGNHHPTVKPTDLMRYLCRLVTPPGGVVLDPFTGSGSTGRGAILEGFRFVGIEREADYLTIARARIDDAVAMRASETSQLTML